MASARSNGDDFDKADVPKLAPNRLPTEVKMAVIKQPRAANANQTSQEMPVMKFDHVFSSTLLQEDTPKRIIFSETVKVEGFSFPDIKNGVWIQFSSKAVSDPKLMTCFLWNSSVVSPPLEDNEALVSNVIELACDDSDGINFSGVTVALSHSATDLGGYELVMKELVNSRSNTWKDLETAMVGDLITSDPSHGHIESENGLPFLQGKVTSFSLYAVICRLKTYTFSSSTSVKNAEFVCQVPDYPDLSVSIPRRTLSKDLILTMKVQHVRHKDSQEKKVFVGPILHVSCALESELQEPATISIPISMEQDQPISENLLSTQVRTFYRDTRDTSQEWTEITRQLKTPARLENGVVTFKVNHFSTFVNILIDSFVEIDIQSLLKQRQSFVSQMAGFQASLCDTGHPVKHLLVLCCFPLHMRNQVWKEVFSKYRVVRHGQDTSRHPLRQEDKAFFHLPDGFIASKESDKETNYLKFPGKDPFTTCLKVRFEESEWTPQIRFFKQNGDEVTLCDCILSTFPTSSFKNHQPTTSQDTSLLSPHEEADILQQKTDLVTETHILKIQHDVGIHWRELGIKLGIEPAKVSNLEQDCNLCKDRAFNVLKLWMNQEGSDATMGRLACTLISIGQRIIADKLLGKPTERKAPDDISSIFKEIRDMIKMMTEQEKKKMEAEKRMVEELKEMLNKVRQMKGQVQRLEIEMKEYVRK